MTYIVNHIKNLCNTIDIALYWLDTIQVWFIGKSTVEWVIDYTIVNHPITFGITTPSWFSWFSLGFYSCGIKYAFAIGVEKFLTKYQVN